MSNRQRRGPKAKFIGRVIKGPDFKKLDSRGKEAVRAAERSIRRGNMPATSIMTHLPKSSQTFIVKNRKNMSPFVGGLKLMDKNVRSLARGLRGGGKKRR